MEVHRRKKYAGTGTVSRYDDIITTGFLAGHIPYAPGTMGALVALAVWCLYAYCIPFIADSYVIVMNLTSMLTVLLIILGIPAIDRVETVWGPDPKRVVVDEMIGMWMALFGVPASREWYWVLSAFLLFRLFDIWKPLGIRWLDRNIHGGMGVVLDDMLAGLYSAAVMLIVRAVVG